MAMMDDSRDMLSRLESIDREALSDVNRYGYDALKRAVEVNLMYEDYYYYDEPLTPLNGLQTLMPLSMVFFNIRSLRDVEDYLFLVEDMERYLDLVGVFESEKAEEGLFMTEVALDQVIESLRSFAAMGEESTLITSFDAVAEKARELGMSEEDCASASSRNREAVLEHVLPAYSRLADTLESHRKDCSEFVGAAARGDKAKAYFELSARDEGATMDPMDKVVDLLDEMGNSTYMDLYMAIVFGPDDLYDRYGEDISFGSVENNLEWLGGFVKKYYPEMPDYSLRYIDVPEDIAEDFSPAAYLTPAFDDTYDNLMILNPYSEGSDDLLTIAHETIPGHMYQFLTARNTPGLSVSQQLIEPTGYAEGWTVFSEYFVATHCDEIGSEYCTMMNCESTFFNIYMPAYISIMVNYEGWDLDDVYDLLQEYELDDAAEIFYEYAVTMPNYAMSYAIGYAYMLHIYEEANPRSASEHKAFFEKYLSFGPCYMDMMIEYMR
ncbi:MAG: DUF885 family protein, partial [Clostridia bacterium]|nr:DUF885 family protein [Clostridia bacterium]